MEEGGEGMTEGWGEGHARGERVQEMTEGGGNEGRG